MSGSPLEVRTWGSGTPVLLIHGSSSPDAVRTWAAQESLSDRYRLIIPSRRGYGASPPNAFRDVEAEVRDLVGLLEDGTHLVGLSFGAVMALLVAAEAPQMVRSLTVIEPPAMAVARGVPAVEDLLERVRPVYDMTPAATPEQFARAFAKALVGQDLPEPLQMPPEQRQATLAHMNEAPPWAIAIPTERLAALAVPKLVVSGQWHPAFEAMADALSGQIGAERAVFPGAGHGVQLTGEPFNARLISLWER